MRRLANLHRFEVQPEPRRSTAAEITKALLAARAYIAKGWSSSSVALTAEGRPTTPDGPGAVCWNIAGAFTIAVALRECGWDASIDASFVLKKFVPEGYVDRWNREPGRTQAEVLALFDQAVASLGGGGAVPAPFRSHEEWKRWCERDRADEDFEMTWGQIR